MPYTLDATEKEAARILETMPTDRIIAELKAKRRYMSCHYNSSREVLSTVLASWRMVDKNKTPIAYRQMDIEDLIGNA